MDMTHTGRSVLCANFIEHDLTQQCALFNHNHTYQVVKVSKRDTEAVEHTPTPDPHSRFASVLDSPHKPRSSSETATPLDQLNIMSLRSNRERKDAIVAVVTSSLSTGSRQPVKSALSFEKYCLFILIWL